MRITSFPGHLANFKVLLATAYGAPKVKFRAADSEHLCYERALARLVDDTSKCWTLGIKGRWHRGGHGTGRKRKVQSAILSTCRRRARDRHWIQLPYSLGGTMADSGPQRYRYPISLGRSACSSARNQGVCVLPVQFGRFRHARLYYSRFFQ